MILVLPTLALFVLTFFALCSEGIFLVCITVLGIPAYVWYLLGVVGYGVGARLLLTSQSSGRIALGAVLSMFPVVAIMLEFFFFEYHGS